jgi:hypothetical protein
MNSLNPSAFLHQKKISSPEELWSHLKKLYFKVPDSTTTPLADWKNKTPEKCTATRCQHDAGSLIRIWHE